MNCLCFCCSDKTPSPRVACGTKGFVSVTTFRPYSITKRNPGKIMETKTEAEAIEDGCLLACSP